MMKRTARLLFAIFLLPLALHAQVVAYDFSALYDSASPAVVQVSTDDGTGSGFLITPFGHIATNFHVVRNSRYLAVQFHDGRRVKAEVIAVNTKYDLALIKVNSTLVREIRPLQLLPEEKDPLLKVGIPVVALGSPLNQKFLMTQGILSKVDDETLLGDFLLQAGNSGGPLLNINGQVVGINTFGESSISGAVRIGPLRDLLKTDEIWDSIDTEPAGDLLPTLSTTRYPVDVLNLKVQTEPLDWNSYRFKAGDFDVTAITPVLVGKLQSITGKLREENRYARRSKFISDPEFHGSNDPYYEWHRTTETALDYAVTFDIRPVSGLTHDSKRKSSKLLNPLFIFERGRKLDMEFKAEFLDFRVYRDGQLIQPVMPGRQIIEGKTELKGSRFIDEAYAGSYVYAPKEFLTGNEFRVEVVDARKPDEVHKEVVFTSDSPLIRQIRSDFTFFPSHFFFAKVP
jgi:trypsin-like peptidase